MIIAHSVSSSTICRKRNQKGQVLILGLVLMIVAALTIITTFNTGRVVNDKTQLVNAADAAAYSAGVNVARQLNFMAYTNRSMMASHVAVGHMVSYVSWARTIASVGETLAGVIESFAALIPDASYIAELVEAIIGLPGTAADNIAPIYIAVNQGLIYSQTVAQKATYDALTNFNGTGDELSLSTRTMILIANLHQLGFYQDSTLRKRIYVNNMTHLEYIYNRVEWNDQSALETIREELSLQDEVVSGFLNYDEIGNVDIVYDLAEKSIEALASRDWFRDRGWDRGFLKRNGSTGQVVKDGRLNWTASDQYIIDVFGSTSVVGGGSADADTLCLQANEINSLFSCDQGYFGFAKHYEIATTAPLRPVIKLSAFLTKQVYTRLLSSAAYDESSDAGSRNYMSAIARAEVFFERPCGKLGCSWGFEEYVGEEPNLYNPFWRTRLTQ